MPAAVFVVPGSLDTRTGGSIYDRRIVDGLRRLGWSVDVRELDASFPFPTPAAVAGASAALAALPSGTVVVIDGLALSVLPDLAERERSRLAIVALVHLPVAADVGLDHDTALRVAEGERRALGAAALVVVTGSATRALLRDLVPPSARVVVVEPGTDPAPPARGSTGGPVNLLSVATLNPTKGHDLLLRALAAVPDRDWRLTCVGSVTRHPATADRIRRLADDLNLSASVSLVGERDAAGVAAAYDGADVFVLATRQETYGMAVAEAVARGLPVVSTDTGAIATLVGDAGIVVPPDDLEALTHALARVIGSADLRSRFAAASRQASTRLPTWDAAAVRMAAALSGIDTHE